MASHLPEDELIALAASGGAIPEHVEGCTSCAARLREFRQTLELTGTPPEMEWNRLHAGAFQHRVRQAIGDTHRAPRVISWWQPALSGAVVALVAVFAYQSLLGPPEADVPASITAAPAEQPMGADLPTGEGGLLADDAEALDGTDDELFSAIDSYLLDTASDDELFSSLGDLSDDGAVVVLDD